MGFQNGFVWRFNIILFLLAFSSILQIFFSSIYTFLRPSGMVHLANRWLQSSHSIIHVAPSRSPTEVWESLLDPQGWNWNWNCNGTGLTVNRILVPARRKKFHLSPHSTLTNAASRMIHVLSAGHKIDSPDPVLSFPHDDTRWPFFFHRGYAFTLPRLCAN